MVKYAKVGMRTTIAFDHTQYICLNPSIRASESQKPQRGMLAYREVTQGRSDTYAVWRQGMLAYSKMAKHFYLLLLQWV